MIKRILLIFVCIFSTILCFAEGITVGNFCYDIIPGSSEQLKATLVVPKGSVDAYKNSKYDWSKFATKVEGDAAPAGKPETLKNVVVDGITYNTYAKNQTAELCNGQGCKDDVIIPKAIEINGVEYAVTKINDYSFDLANITSVSLPNTLETLGNWAFKYCI